MKSCFYIILLYLTSFVVFGDLREIHLLATTDIHSHFRAENPEKRGAWLRLASLIDSKRKEYGFEKTDSGFHFSFEIRTLEEGEKKSRPKFNGFSGQEGVSKI